MKKLLALIPTAGKSKDEIVSEVARHVLPKAAEIKNDASKPVVRSISINSDRVTHQPPYSVVILDATDAYYYADVMENMEEYARVEDFGKAIALADALFVVKNYRWDSLAAMNDVDGGYDVRVYDSTFSCVYAAHTRYADDWIGSEGNEGK
jgi:hypothetical protein